MDDSFNNVLEGTRQYFMGLPKQPQDGSGQQLWPAGAAIEEGTPVISGVPATSSRPSSAAARPSSTPTPIIAPPRPPSEPLEPEPHFIHKATVMREAAEKRREQPEIDDEEEPVGALSPPTHIIHKPTPRAMPSPVSAPVVPCSSPVRPPSVASLSPLVNSEQVELSVPYRTSVHRVKTPTIRPAERYTPGRQQDPYSASRPPESYSRYQYDSNSIDGGRLSHGSSVASPQPSVPHRHSPTSYARMSGSVQQHSSRYTETSMHNPAMLRYSLPTTQPPPPHNDRVPPIHHPQVAPQSKRLTMIGSRSTHAYHRRDSYANTRHSSLYERSPAVAQRKYDTQQAYSGYRTSISQLPANTHVEKHHPSQYKHGFMDTMSAHYPTRTPDRALVPPPQHVHDNTRIALRGDYHNKSNIDSKSSYNYSMPSTSSVRYMPTAPVQPSQNSSLHQSRSTYRSVVAPKLNHEYTSPTQIQTSPSRPTIKPVCPSQQNRMTVSVTSIVNEMNQTKHKRESPLDLSVKTVKNSADSSTTQDDVIDSASMKIENISLHPRITSHHRNVAINGPPASHKVDFAPDFAQYRERINHGYNSSPQPSQPVARQNGVFESTQQIPEPYSLESRHQNYTERSKYQASTNKNEFIPRIDLTRSNGDDHFADSRLRDDRNIIIEERKRVGGQVDSNIPDKLMRYETWSADSRIERMSQSAKEQNELMSRPVYNYTSHKRFEAYQNDHKRPLTNNVNRDQRSHVSQRYSSNTYCDDVSNRDVLEYYNHCQDKISSSSSRHVIQKIPNHKDGYNMTNHIGAQPADKKVLSILRINLETKHTNVTNKPKHIPDLIVIDDVDDSVIEITDITKDNDKDVLNKSTMKINKDQVTPSVGHHIQMPKAIDSISRDDQRFDNTDIIKSKSPENDVASRIRTKAELKVMPPSQDNSTKQENKTSGVVQGESNKLLPKSQKQHLFNQIREDNLRLESVIKKEDSIDKISIIKTEPISIEEIEKDAILPIKKEKVESSISEASTSDIVIDTEIDKTKESNNAIVLDMDWAKECDSFMEELKTGCHKKKAVKKVNDSPELVNENNMLSKSHACTSEKTDNLTEEATLPVSIKQEPIDPDDSLEKITSPHSFQKQSETDDENKLNVITSTKRNNKENDRLNKNKTSMKNKNKSEKNDRPTNSSITIKKEQEEITVNTVVKEEIESTDDDEPLIKSKILKEKEKCDRLNYQLLKDLSEKSAYVKLECCDERVNTSSRKSTESVIKDKEEKPNKTKITKQNFKSKTKYLSIDNIKNEKEKDLSSDSEEDDLSVASRLRTRKNIKTEENKANSVQKTPVKSPASKKGDTSSSCSTPLRKPGFGDGSDFHPGWEEELYRYKRSLRMPTRLIAIPRGRSDGPFVKRCGNQLARGSSSLPDLDPVPLSPAPSSAPSVATDDLYRQPEKLTIDSDVESNSSSSANRLQYDSEASSSTGFSVTKTKKNTNSIVDVLIRKCGQREESKKRPKEKEDKALKIIPKSNGTELLPTPSLGLIKNGNKGNLSAKKEKLMEDIFYLGAFRKETVAMFRTAFINDTNGLIGATEEFAPVVLKSRTRTESRVLKQRATIKEVFGDDRPASAPPTSCRDDFIKEEEEQAISVKKEVELKPKFKTKTNIKDKIKRRSSSIRDGLRSTKSLKRNDAKGRLLRLKKRNSLLKNFSTKRMKEMANNKVKKDTSTTSEKEVADKDISKESNGSPGPTEVNTKRRLKRLFGRRKFSSGFDYIRKKKKVIRREGDTPKIRRQAPKPTPESVHDIQKEIKGWFINKSIGETHLHRAARLGFTDCVAYCLEKLKADPSAKDNAGFTPLHVASAKGHVRIARLLLQYGSNISAAAQGGIRPLHEACENSHVEVVRLLLSYGADPLLGTYAGQMPEELAEGQAAIFLRLHIADVQGHAVEPWRFPPPTEIIDREELGCDPLSSPPPASPPPPPDAMMEIQCTEAPLPPFYSLRTASGQPADGLWCLLQDVTSVLQIKSKESLLKQIHCGSGSPKELLQEIRTQEFLERAQCHQLLCAGEKVNVRASKVALIRVTDKLRQLLKIETVLVS